MYVSYVCNYNLVILLSSYALYQCVTSQPLVTSNCFPLPRYMAGPHTQCVLVTYFVSFESQNTIKCVSNTKKENTFYNYISNAKYTISQKVVHFYFCDNVGKS